MLNKFFPKPVNAGIYIKWLSVGLVNKSKKQEVEIYRPGQEVEILKLPLTLSGEDVLPGLAVNLGKIWG